MRFGEAGGRSKSARIKNHGTHIRSQKACDVRALEPHGQTVHPGGQGHCHRGPRRRPGSGLESHAAARAAERARRQYAEGQDRCGDPARLAARRPQNYQEILYEGYAPHGVALLVETATDNPTRTVGSLRNIFAKGAGNLGTTGSVSFLFKKMGVFRLSPASVKDQDELELDLIDHGLEEMGESTGDKGEPQLVIRCAFNDFGKLQEALEARDITPLSAEHEYICSVPTELPEERAAEVLALIDKLEQDDDVQKVFHTLA